LGFFFSQNISEQNVYSLSLVERRLLCK